MKTLNFFVLLFFFFCSTTYIGCSQEIKVQRISDRVYSIYIDHYNSLVVIGEEGVLLVDPANTQRAKWIKKEIEKLTPLPVQHIVLSHEHYDHVGGTEVFPQAKIYAQTNAKSIFKLDVRKITPQKIHYWFDTNMSISIGNTAVDLYHFGAGDGLATTVLHLPKEKVVFCADMFSEGGLTDKKWIEDSNPLGIRIILNELVKLKPHYVINAHYKDLNPRHLIRASEFYNDLYLAVAPPVIEAANKGFSAVLKTIAELPKEVKLEHHNDLKNYDHLPSHVHKMVMAVFRGG